ncbi:MAG: Eco57I restriction-modification methylase domain-containing protein [Solirubrobacterales bacterium]
MALRGTRSTEGALNLLRALGYETDSARPYDLGDVGLTGVGTRLRAHQRRGYGVLVAEVDDVPRSLKTVGRRLIDGFHDQPLLILGVRGTGAWESFAIVRPRLVKGGGGAVTIARLVVRPSLPTVHDVEVVSHLAWRAERSDAQNQDAIDRALDVERVTKRFFVELNAHYRVLVQAVSEAAAGSPAVHAGIEQARGADRVALRIVTQALFAYFLQRKGLLEGRPAWLSDAYRAQLHAGGGFYEAVLEPLCYEALNVPSESRADAWQKPGIPFLNGGLFERRYGAVSLPLPDTIFSTEDGLLGFLDGWSFTVSEERADETEVAVDPEMLGKVFENLISDDERRNQGTVYTPRPVVQFMCREALVPYLQRTCAMSESEARCLIDGDDPFGALGELAGVERAAEVAPPVDCALAGITVLDPAVGSGAFLLGMLSEIARLRGHAHAVTAGQDADLATRHAWRRHAIQSSLFGVDINPTAIELCRLRLWLALLVDTPDGVTPEPLPNLEFRTVPANSLTDFVAGVEVQNSRDGAASLDVHGLDPAALVNLRERYFNAADPAGKAELHLAIGGAEDALLASIFARARENAGHAAKISKTRALGEQALADIATLEAAFHDRDRIFPAFMPAFHAPEVMAGGGWDVVIMNPPYLSRKEIAQHLDAVLLRDLELHYGRTADLMIHFAWRALQLIRAGGVMSMIFNDSIFTSTDGAELRRRLLAGPEAPETVHVAARTRCFEGVAVNGGVIVASRGLGHDSEIRWVENHGRPTNDLLAAGRIAEPTRSMTPVGASELFEVPAAEFHRLPHRPLFRPSRPARDVLPRFARCAAWNEFGRFDAPDGGASWELLSNTRALARWSADARRAGFYDALKPGRDWVLLGLVVEGGQGLATADDRRFLAAIDGTAEAEAARATCRRLEELTLRHEEAGARYRTLVAVGAGADDALLAIADEFGASALGWPRSGLLRIAPPDRVRSTALTADEVAGGIASGATWVPFEKGDDSGEDGGAARWRRENPLVIDWSPVSVALLRQRVRAGGSRSPRLQNERLWGQGGCAFNRIASYLRVRRVPDAGIFSDKTPTIGPSVDWLSVDSLLALLNAPVVDFCVRTFLGSRMQIEIGDIRRLPVPVLDGSQASALDLLGRRAVAAKEALDAGAEGEPLGEIEHELDLYTRELYGVAADADLWVVR